MLRGQRYALLPALLLAMLIACQPAAETPPSLPEWQAKLPGAEDCLSALMLLRQNNIADALPLLRRAAEVDHPEAQYQLGILYARGDSVAKDMSESHRLLMAAAIQGHYKAQYYLGHMYGRGDGVKKDYQESLVWFWLAASYGDTGAQRYMRVVIPKLTPEQYREAEKRVHELWHQMPSASKKGIRKNAMPMH